MSHFLSALLIVLSLMSLTLSHPLSSQYTIIGRYQTLANSLIFDFSHAQIRCQIGVKETRDAEVETLSVTLQLKQRNTCQSDACDRFKVQIMSQDGSKAITTPQTIALSNASDLHALSFNVSTSESQVQLQLTKMTEALVGSVEFYGVEVVDETKDGIFYGPLALEHEQEEQKNCKSSTPRRIEVFGDSLTCGYGNLGKDPCPFTSATEDATQTYASFLAQYFNAQLSKICISGIGLLHSYGSETAISPVNQYKLLPQSIAADNSSKWDFSLFKPDLVIIYLGANDFSTKPQPTGDLWMEYYVKYLNNIWSAYGNESPQQFVLLCGWAEREEPWCGYVREVAQRWNSARGSGAPEAHAISIAHIQKRPEMDGCNTHPNVEANRLIFEALKPQIEEIMGW